MLTKKNLLLAAAFAAATAAPINAMTVEASDIKSADECVQLEINVMAWDVGFVGGGALVLEASDIENLVAECEKITGDLSQFFKNITGLRMDNIPAFGVPALPESNTPSIKDKSTPVQIIPLP